MFTDKQLYLLKLNLDGSRVKTRQQGNVTLSYLEGHDIIDTANMAFGFGNWSYGVKELIQISEETNANQNLVIGYKALVTVTVYDIQHKHQVTREDVGFGIGIAKDYATAHESAGKEAVTDAMKRAFRTFGNQFGNALYDKSQKNVDHGGQATPPRPPSTPYSNQSAPQDPFATLRQLGLRVEEFGGRLIVQGKTYGKQQQLKEAGFRWDPERKVWYREREAA
jgi:DNA repair and recombination protein RAD52